jgi:hypothetical protein
VEKKSTPIDSEGSPLYMNKRLKNIVVGMVEKDSVKLRLEEAILVGNVANQVTLDYSCFRLNFLN